MESLFSQTDDIWNVIEFAFFKAQGGWVDVLNHIVRGLRNDFEECKEIGTEAIDKCTLAQWLKGGRSGSLKNAVRCCCATSGLEMLDDKPIGIYENVEDVKPNSKDTGDIFGGSIVLSHRLELLTMVPLHPQSANGRYLSLQLCCQTFVVRVIISSTS